MTRRRAIKTVAGGAVLATTGVAGSEIATASTATQENTSGAIESIAMDEGWLIVQCTSPDAVDSVTLFDPNGQERASRTLKVGERATRFRMITQHTEEYEPGQFRAVAYGSSDSGDTEEVGTAEMDLEPSATLTGFHYAAGGEVRVTIRNDGSGPVFIQSIRIENGVPEPDAMMPFLEVNRALAPGNRFVAYMDDTNPVSSDEKDKIEEFVGETRTAEFKITHKNGDVTDSLDLTFEGGPVNHRYDEYTFETVAGGTFA